MTVPGRSPGNEAGSVSPAFPYDRPGYAETHDGHYNLSTINRPHFEFECATVERLISERGVRSWCDLACGTGLHLRRVYAPHPVRRTGIDRSAAMLQVARNSAGAVWVEADVRDLAATGAHDLVTAFWYGYIHQPSLDEVRRFLLSSSAQVAPGGAFLLGLCDPAGIFEDMLHGVPMVYESPMYIDAVVWRFTEPWEGDRFTDCIAPHPALIREWLEPRFGSVDTLHYPPSGGPKANWRRKALLFTDHRSRPSEIGQRTA